MHLHIDDTTKARFIKGVLLAWIPFLCFMLPLFVSLFRSFSTEKATGIGAVAGGVSEGLATFGLAAIVISQIAAILLLARTFNRAHALRGFFSVVSICCSLILLAFIGLAVWLLMRLPG